MPLNLTTFRVGDLVHEVMSELEPIIKRSNLTVTARTAAPRCRPLKSDRQKVKQIVLNLLSNALKFTPAGSVTIAASYDAEEPDGRHRRRGHGRRHRRGATSARCSRISASSTARRRGATAAPAWGFRFAGAWRRCSAARSSSSSAVRARDRRSRCACRPVRDGDDVTTMTQTASRSCSSSRTTRTRARCTPPTCSSPDYRVAEATNGVEAIEKTVELHAGHHPDGPGAAADGRLGGDAPAEGGRADAAYPDRRADRPRAGRARRRARGRRAATRS